MDQHWTELQVSVPAQEVDTAAAIAQMVVPYGIYIEDYSDLVTEAPRIAHIDLIDEDLLAKDRETAIIHIYINPEENPAEAIRSGLAGSAVLDAKAPMMLARNFQPGGKLSINMKDIKNVLATAHQADVPLPLSAGLYEIMTSLKNMGCLDNDHSGIVKFYERLAGVEVRPQ